ncbi:MAG: monooxygenase [Actinomycetes bacterium]
MPADVVPVVTLHVWGVPARAVPLAVARMAWDRPLMRRTDARFWKLLGTGRGRTFTATDADPRRWAVLATWDDDAAADAFESSPTVRGWGGIAEERLAVRLRPLASRGEWSGRRPFGEPRPRRVDGPVASITRARIRPRKTLSFHRAVPPVSHDLRQVDGVRLAVGIGEAPVGLQGTFSVWESADALLDFAHRRNPHREVVRRTAEQDWYAEELFARFEVLDIAGTLGGHRA